MPPHQESQEPNALEVIFTCDVCQASISDLYRSDDSATDFQDGRSEGSDRRVTSLWLTSCMHLTCGNHLEGGGAPFHPQGEHPQAPCPFCVTKNKDDRPRKLYAVRGWDKGSYDAAIPDVLFQAPPMQLDGQDMRMEALNVWHASPFIEALAHGNSFNTNPCSATALLCAENISSQRNRSAKPQRPQSIHKRNLTRSSQRITT
ncbi:hypothetical protein BKA81DRAFT_170589 [Phyllosticta paracitricarpa]